MFVGNWQEQFEYVRGDIVYNYVLCKYFICSEDHVSTKLGLPCQDDLHWIIIERTFLDSYRKDTELKKRASRRHSSEPLDTPFRVIPEEELQHVTIANKLKRKLDAEERSIENFKRSKTSDTVEKLRDQLLLLDMDVATKSFLVDKHDNTCAMTGTDYSKGINWLRTVISIPHGKYKELKIRKDDSVDNIKDFFKEVKAKLDKNIYGLEDVKQEILEFIARKITNPKGKGEVLALCGSQGVGKCHGIDTEILMYDGTIKKVQDVLQGDLLMGDDSQPRKVLSIARGREELYEVRHTLHGESYVVNKSHILSLKFSRNSNIYEQKKRNRYVVGWFDKDNFKYRKKTFVYASETRDTRYKEAKLFCTSLDTDKVVDIPLTKYVGLPKSVQLLLQGYKVGVEFPRKQTPFDPYIIGLWLGDGSSGGPGITTQDSTVLRYLSKVLPSYGCYLSYNGAQYDYRINGFRKQMKQKGIRSNANPFLEELRRCDLINNKHIPDDYKINDRENRLKMLAGLIDSDGSLRNGKNAGYEIIQKNDKLSLDIVFVCRSLGFQCKIKQVQKGCYYKTEYKESTYNRIYIYGNGLEEVPTKCLRKRAIQRKQIKDPMVTGIEIVPKGEGEYFGFEIDGNHRYLLANFIVTHNTKIIKSLAEALELPFYQINCGGCNDVAVLTGHSETYVGSKAGKIVEALQSSKYMNPIIYLDELDKISDSKAREINGVLTHLLDEEQNNKFQDNYLSNIPLDLSKVFFVLSFNDISKVDEIVSDRMKILYIEKPTLEEKVLICREKVIPEIIDSMNFDFVVQIDKEVIEYIVLHKCEAESGIRQLKKCIEKVLNKFNYDVLVNNVDDLKLESDKETIIYIITKKYVDQTLFVKNQEQPFLSMYI